MYVYGGEFTSCDTVVWKFTFGKQDYNKKVE